MPVATADLVELQRSGVVQFPPDPQYETACAPWNTAVAQRPVAVAVPRTIEEVCAVVRAAVASGLKVAPQSTGHAAAALAVDALDGTLLLRMHKLTGVRVDVVARTARIVGGTLWADVLAETAVFGLTALHGSAGDVSAVGFLLGGGLSFYGRAHGLASSTVRVVEIVTADGAVLRASATDNADLFWAVRGGGGSFGVVVAVEIDLLPLADVVAGVLLWDMASAPTVLATWADWTASLPEAATTSLRLMRFAPAPELPDFLRGRELVVIDGTVLGDDETAARILAPMRSLGPEIDTFARVPSAAVLQMHMDPPGPTPTVTDHALLSALPAEAVQSFLAMAGPGATTPLMIAELRHLGGALAREIDAALPSIAGEYLLFCVAMADTPESAAAGMAAASALVAGMSQHATGRVFLNFDDSPSDGAMATTPQAWARLRDIRAVHDPIGVWVAAHPVR